MDNNKTKAQRGNWLTALLALILLYFMWPMAKGLYYKNFANQNTPPAVRWEESFEAAVAESEKSGKPILLDFSASWCPPCQVMKHEVWTDQEVGEVANAGYVPFLVDVDLPENRSLAGRYQVSGIPDIVVVNAQGQILKRTGFLSAAQMTDFLKQ